MAEPIILFAVTLPKYGIKVKFVDPEDPENFRTAITDKTKAVFAETIGNPSLRLLILKKWPRLPMRQAFH